jgi:hypothetical protein
MSDTVALFIADHALHIVVSVFLVWFLWKAIRMAIGTSGRPEPGPTESSSELAPGRDNHDVARRR